MAISKWKLEAAIHAALKQAAVEHRLDVAEYLLQALETLAEELEMLGLVGDTAPV
jgi:hypothetical protein